MLLAVLARLGRGWIRKCLRFIPCCKTETVGLIIKDSAQLGKEERKAQLGQQMDCFLWSCLVIGYINMFLPHLVMIVAGPVALFMVLWLWWTELQNQGRLCCRGAARAASAAGGDPIAA